MLIVLLKQSLITSTSTWPLFKEENYGYREFKHLSLPALRQAPFCLKQQRIEKIITGTRARLEQKLSTSLLVLNETIAPFAYKLV